MAGRTGAALFAGAGALTLLNTIAAGALGADGADVARVRICALLALVSAVVTWFVPWARLRREARLAVAAWGLVLLLMSGAWGRYATTTQAASGYPVFFVLILAWIGMTQRPGRAALFSLLIVEASVWMSRMPHNALPLSGLLLATGAAMLVGETIAFVAERNRQYTRKLGALVRASSALRDVLTFDEGVERAVEALRDILNAEDAHFATELCVEPSPEDLCVPLTGPTGAVGVVALHGVRLDAFTDQLVHLASSEFGARLEQLRVLEALGEQSISDALTGVGNRRHADALTNALEPGDAVLLIDLDRFKTINDDHGHLAGDRVLEELGAYLKTALREEDSVARYGGDEFLVRLRLKQGDPQKIAARLLDGWIRTGALVSFSIGVAVHIAGQLPTDTFEAADRALYEAKESGRARVCAA
ncbi:MAG TPA: GGDEF domain-containing protein [Acidimicrobiia bacterium]|nr:GGDEF domain-containing protein [Acidimicrobiia bacterium]